jgi:predicted Zn-dependent peptidase
MEVNHVLGVINTEIKKIQGGEVSKSDLAAAREHLIGGILLSSESTDNRMMRLARNEYIFGRYMSYEELVASLEKVTVDEVVDVADETFQTDQVSLVTLGRTKSEDLDLACLQFD